MRKRMSLVCTVVSLTVMLGFDATALAGDLNPPPGPVAPTMKTLVEVEPRTSVQSLPGSKTAIHVISQAGSYYLVGNINGVAGKNGIVIAADDVTLDLSGFTLVGVPGSLDGINVAGTHANATVRNGRVQTWGGQGIFAWNATHTALYNVRAVDNGGRGFYAGDGTIADGCIASGNTLDGFRLGVSSTVRSCVALSNSDDGFDLNRDTLILGCMASSNDQGITTNEGCTVSSCISSQNAEGIRVGVGSTVKDCTTDSNANGYGIIAGASSTITNCTAKGNGDGIVAGEHSTIHGCMSSGNSGVGIRANDGCTVMGCTVSTDQVGIVAQKSVTISTCTATNNNGNGISAGNGSTITHCTAGFNGDNGITLGNSGSITGCTLLGNHFDGIAVNSGVKIVGNTCDQNANVGTGAGIHITSDECLIQGNNLSNNRRGIWSVAGGNVIVKNNAIGNLTSNYDLHAADIVGTITSNPTTANAWANFSN